MIQFCILIVMAALAVTLVSAARAQEAPPSPQVRALSERIMTELNTSLGCTTQVIILQDKIKELEAKLKAQEK